MSYNADDILEPDARTHLIKRMGLTFGGEGADPDYPYSHQKTVAAREIIDNATDEIRDGYGNCVRLRIYENGVIEVQDSGRGIPTDVNHKTHESGIYMAMGKTHSGGKFSTDSKRYSAGLNGVGGGSVALVSDMTITVFRDGKQSRLDFNNGVPGFFKDPNDFSKGFDSLKSLGKDLSYLKKAKDDRPAAEKKEWKTGTIVRFRLDDSAFMSSDPVDDQDLVDRLQWTAFLVPQLKAEVWNERKKVDGKPYEDSFHYPEGIPSMVDYLAPSDRIIPIQSLKTEGFYNETAAELVTTDGQMSATKANIERSVPIELAFTWSGDPTVDRDYRMYSFVNAIHTKLGGVHVKAFEKALVQALNSKLTPALGHKAADPDPKINDWTEGLTMVLSVEQSEPSFSSQSKEELLGKENQKAILEALTSEFLRWATSKKGKPAFEIAAKKAIQACNVRTKSEEEKLLKRKKNKVTASAMPEKLADCKNVNEEGSELFICEGDSARGGLVNARDSDWQAVLPVRGKSINASKASVAGLLNNKEVQGIVRALGAGLGKDFDVDNVRYSRVIVATDADDDGYHIQNLILVIFWKLFKQMVLDGRFYVAVPPLFEIGVKGEKRLRHAVDQAELDDIIKTMTRSGKKLGSDYTISRNKGLGENDDDVTSDTMMDPRTRVLKKIDAKDVDAAERALELTLGSNVENRRDWIENSADFIDVNDIMV